MRSEHRAKSHSISRHFWETIVFVRKREVAQILSREIR